MPLYFGHGPPAAAGQSLRSHAAHRGGEAERDRVARGPGTGGEAERDRVARGPRTDDEPVGYCERNEWRSTTKIVDQSTFTIDPSGKKAMNHDMPRTRIEQPTTVSPWKTFVRLAVWIWDTIAPTVVRAWFVCDEALYSSFRAHTVDVSISRARWDGMWTRWCAGTATTDRGCKEATVRRSRQERPTSSQRRITDEYCASLHRGGA
jgi:hypothetical protein